MTQTRAWPLAIAAVAAFAVMLALFWSGPIGSDDSLYWNGATGWLHHFPYIANDHWGLRHPFVLSIALARLLLGDGPAALLGPGALAGGAIVLILTLWTYRVAGRWAGVATLLLLASSPQLIFLSSAGYIDPVELLCVFGGFVLLQAAIEMEQDARAAGAPPRAGRQALFLIGAGVLAGLALISRETSLFAITAAGLLFLAGFGMPRHKYIAIGLGAAFLIGAEILLYWFETGDPFHRVTISLHHDSTINRWEDQGLGVPLIHPLIDPITLLLLNHYNGLIFTVGTGLSVWLLLRGRLSPAGRRWAVMLAVLSLVWTVCAAALWKLLPLTPRYYAMPMLGLSVLAAMAVASLAGTGRKRWAVAWCGVLLLGNLAGLLVENHNFMFGERALLTVMATQPGMVHTDAQTFRRAELMLTWQGSANRLTSEPPGPGDLYYDNPTRRPSTFRPGPGWVVVQQYQPDLPPTRAAFQALARALKAPDAVLRATGPGHPGTTLYRVP